MVKAFEQTPTISLIRDKILFIKNIYMRKVGRILFWAALVCAMVLPLVAQAKVISMPLTAPANYCQISAQNCHMSDCACPCCQKTSNQRHKSNCRCQSVSLLSLHAVDAGAPGQQKFPSFAFYTAPPSSLLITDIFRPPKS